MTDIRVVIADDHTIFRKGLNLLISRFGEMLIVGEASDWGELPSVIAEQLPDIVTLDLSMPGADPISGIRRIREQFPRVRLVVLTMHEEEAYLRAAIAAGADGYVSKRAADTQLLTTLNTVLAGQIHFEVETRSLSDNVKASGDVIESPVELARLSERELEVFRSAAMGLTNREIALTLHLSIKTVESYRSRLMTKLGVATRAELVRCAIDSGLLNGEQRQMP